RHLPDGLEVAAGAWSRIRGACDSRNAAVARGAAGNAAGEEGRISPAFQHGGPRLSRPETGGKNAADDGIRGAPPAGGEWESGEATVCNWRRSCIGGIR